MQLVYGPAGIEIDFAERVGAAGLCASVGAASAMLAGGGVVGTSVFVADSAGLSPVVEFVAFLDWQAVTTRVSAMQVRYVFIEQSSPRPGCSRLS